MNSNNDNKYAKRKYQVFKEVAIIISFATVLCIGFYRLALKDNYDEESNVESKSLSVLHVPDIEFEKFHPGTFKTLGDKQFEDDILNHLKKTIYAYKPKVYNSLETAYFHMLQIRVIQEWDFVMGSVTEFPQQWMTYFTETQKLYLQGNVQTVCEIGMGNGHSSALWLTSTSSDASWKKGATFHLFDICRETPKKKQMYARRYLEKTFGDRFHLHCGDSAETVEAMKELRCDVVHIDGDHRKEGVLKDIAIMHKRTSPGALVFMDDLDYPAIKEAVQENSHILEILAKVETTHVDFNLQSVRHRKPEDGRSKKNFIFGKFKGQPL